jgi:hypothetical protein
MAAAKASNNSETASGTGFFLGNHTVQNQE